MSQSAAESLTLAVAQMLEDAAGLETGISPSQIDFLRQRCRAAWPEVFHTDPPAYLLPTRDKFIEPEPVMPAAAPSNL